MSGPPVSICASSIAYHNFCAGTVLIKNLELGTMDVSHTWDLIQTEQ
jgi:hypothetical protein